MLERVGVFRFFLVLFFSPLPPLPHSCSEGSSNLAAAKKPPLFKTQSLPVLFSFFLPLISFHSRLFVVFFSENMAASSGYVSSSFRLRLRFVSCPSFRFSIGFSFYLGRCVGFALVVLMLGFTCILFHLFVVLVLFSLFILVQVLVLFYWQPFLESPPRPSFEPWRVCGATALPTAKRPNQLCASLHNRA